ncbi:MAG: L-glutamate gamma-semialdehyde dehydrogenase [Deltaproteobacteria bacterium]|nr:L-glutamate gamma-semialdehyde dehydrogenase [Deltaproteobacteria bacterium]
MVADFANEKLTDFTRDENVREMEEALAEVDRVLGREYPLVVNGKEIMTKETFVSNNPSNKDQVVGVIAKATLKEAEEAVAGAYARFGDWQYFKPEGRARILLKAASIMRSKKFFLSALMVVEAGKSWVEADGDTAEAIDFLEFYGQEMIRLSGRQPLTRIAGEDNELYYIPLGVGIAIPPWNFPLAILTGITTAAIVTGNTVILKPATPTPVIGYQLVEIMRDAGLPDGVLNFLPGSGAAIGDFLVGHPKTRFVSFTGSKEIGLRINELAAKTAPGQKWIKRVVAEMGGKDAIVVDEDSNYEEAAQGIVASAFGFQGQKCSACSRTILAGKSYDRVLERVVELTKGITVGNVRDRKNRMGPVITESAEKGILKYIEIGKGEGKLLAGGNKLPLNGYFIEPTVFGDVSATARISQEEIFGPVLAVTKARDFSEALSFANNTEYGLTGAVYSNVRANLERARREFFCGNLYLNRKCTGALVGAHPFGGFNMSGTDSKAGGRDYLQLFMQAKVVSEKL